MRAAQQELPKTVRDLEQRGLLQYDAQSKRYDLHPVVRGIAAGGLQQQEKEQFGQRVIDHFSRQAHRPYEEAETLEDLRHGLQIVRTLIQMSHYQQACNTYRSGLARALHINLEAYSEILSLVRSFFLQGWATLPVSIKEIDASYLVNEAAVALAARGELEQAQAAFSTALLSIIRQANWRALLTCLTNISATLYLQNRLRSWEYLNSLALNLANQLDNEEIHFDTFLFRFRQLAEQGRWYEAEKIWQVLDSMKDNRSHVKHNIGYAKSVYARFRLYRGDLKEEYLTQAEQLVAVGKNRSRIRNLHHLRGTWQLEQHQWALAAESLHEAVRMAREVGKTDTQVETQLTLVKFHLNQLADPRHEAERLTQAKQPAHRPLAELWLAIGDYEQATKHALAAYKWAWADGEPYIHRYELDKTTELLQRLGAEVPKLPPYDPATYVKFPWEDEVVAAIEQLRTEKEAKQAQKRAKKRPAKGRKK